MGRFLLFVLGIVIGAVGVGVVGWTQAKDLMLDEMQSPVGLEETVKRITDKAKADGWAVQSIQSLEASIKKNGGGDVLPIRLVNLCEGHHAGKIMKVDDARRVSVFMPCTISVYEKSDGKTYVSSVNVKLLGRMFGGIVDEVMGHEVAAAQDTFLEAVRATP